MPIGTDPQVDAKARFIEALAIPMMYIFGDDATKIPKSMREIGNYVVTALSDNLTYPLYYTVIAETIGGLGKPYRGQDALKDIEQNLEQSLPTQEPARSITRSYWQSFISVAGQQIK
jgi:hypothetical protein